MIVVDPSHPRGIVWLASFPKSGNTWIRVFLHSLDMVMRGNPPEAIDINQLGRFSISDHNPTLYERYLSRPISTLSADEVMALHPEVQYRLMDGADGVIAVKTHSAQINVDGHQTINRAASAGAVYAIRNPMDVAISLAHFRGIPIDQAIDDMATSMLTVMSPGELTPFVTGSWTENVRSWTIPPQDPVLVVRYEDMLDKPVKTFGGMARHVLVQPNEEQLQAAIDLSAFSQLQAKEKETGFAGKTGQSTALFFREGRSGQWREALTPAQIDRIVDAHGEQMARFGYLP